MSQWEMVGNEVWEMGEMGSNLELDTVVTLKEPFAFYPRAIVISSFLDCVI
jgi:hypothetical protein